MGPASVLIDSGSVCLCVSLSKALKGSLPFVQESSRAIEAELGAQVVSGEKGGLRGASNAESGIGGVGIPSGSLLSAVRATSRFDTADCDRRRPNSFVKVRPRLAAEFGGGTVGDRVVAIDGRLSSSTGMLLNIGGGRFDLYNGSLFDEVELNEDEKLVRSSAVANR